jgi:hypothetical protein
MVMECSTHEEGRNGKRPQGRPRRRCEDDISVTLSREDGMVWTGFIRLWVGNGEKLL